MIDLDSDFAKEIYEHFLRLRKLGLRRYIACLTVLARQFNLTPDIVHIIIEYHDDKNKKMIF